MYIIRNSLTPEEINFALKCFVNDKIDYVSMKYFIEDIMLQIINEKMNWDCIYTKFRVSNNNNSADASTFHRDIIYKNNNNTILPLYTCLMYLDNARMEIIPGSELVKSYSVLDALKTFKNNVKEINLQPGDILIFNSNTLHRGIFTDNLKSRKLIQVFDVHPDLESYITNENKLLHIEGKEKHSNLFIQLSKNKLTGNIMNYYGFLNAATGYGNNNNILNDLGYTDKEIISSEGLRGRVMIDYYERYQPTNKYIFNEKISQPSNVPLEHHNKLHFECYEKQFMIYTLVALAIIVLMIYLIKTLF